MHTLTTTKINGNTYTVSHNPEKAGRIGEIELTGTRGARYFSVANRRHDGLFHFIRHSRSTIANVWDGELFTLDGDTVRPATTKELRK